MNAFRSLQEKRELLKLLEEKNRRERVKNICEYAKHITIPGVPMVGGVSDNALDEDFYPIINQPSEHHFLFLKTLQAVADGKIKRLMVLAPPGSAKSTYISVVGVTWFMGRKPQTNVIFASYSASIANKQARKCRAIVRGAEYEETFKASLVADNTAINDWSVSNGSTFMSSGILASVTGNRADVLIIDDPFKGAATAESPTIRAKTWDEYTASMRTRLKPNGVQIIVNTRWHGDDLSGRILPEDYDGRTGWIESRHGGEKWYVLCLPAQCVRDDDPLKRKIGEYLWTSWFPVSHWENERKVQGERNWNSLYQQTPSSADGGIFLKKWWRKWKKPEPPQIDFVIQVYDTAFEESEQSDPTGCITWGVFTMPTVMGSGEKAGEYDAPHIIMLDAWDERLSYPSLKERVLDGAKERRPDVILVEKKSSGHSLIQDLRKTKAHGGGKLPVMAFKPRDKSKMYRANIASQVLESGHVWLPADDCGILKPYAAKVVEQCAKFPAASHDEYVDICSMSFMYLRRKFWLGLDTQDETDYFAPEGNKGFRYGSR